jgi:hypothetical protein
VSEFEFFTGEVNEHVAHVYARLPTSSDGSHRITGKLRGPMNYYAQTLPANTPWKDLGPGDSTLARAIVTDPCSWSPESPALYQAQIQCSTSAGTVVTQTQAELGIVRFGAQERRFRLAGKRWILRGIYGDIQSDDLPRWREQATTRVVPTFDASFLADASRRGLAVVMDLSHVSDFSFELLLRIARFPCVLMVVVARDTQLPATWRSRVPNLLFAQACTGEDELQPWADVAWVDVATHIPSHLNSCTSPVVAVRQQRHPSFSSARAACDQLQADLAPLGQFAGYVV